jgi:phage terminase large subunit-like protein
MIRPFSGTKALFQAPDSCRIKAQRSGFDSEKEEGAFGYGVFAALTQTAETEWKRLLLTPRKAVANQVLAWNLAASTDRQSRR